MAKKNFTKRIDNAFSSTTPTGKKEISEQSEEMTKYLINYPKSLKKQIKMFCVENDEIDMKDIFIEGAKLYLQKHSNNN